MELRRLQRSRTIRYIFEPNSIFTLSPNAVTACESELLLRRFLKGQAKKHDLSPRSSGGGGGIEFLMQANQYVVQMLVRRPVRWMAPDSIGPSFVRQFNATYTQPSPGPSSTGRCFRWDAPVGMRVAERRRLRSSVAPPTEIHSVNAAMPSQEDYAHHPAVMFSHERDQQYEALPATCLIWFAMRDDPVTVYGYGLHVTARSLTA